jgi:hypothetical protein
MSYKIVHIHGDIRMITGLGSGHGPKTKEHMLYLKKAEEESGVGE